MAGRHNPPEPFPPVPSSRPMSWRRNLFAVTAASFVGFTGFTLVMPFLPLFIRSLGVTDVGEVALWTGLSLGATPAITALLSPFWGRVADRFGRKLMVERSLLSFVIVMAAMAYVTRPWHVLALRGVQGLFAGYGALALTMAAESVPRERMAFGIGLVQTAQRLGPALGPVIGALIAQLVGLRNTFLVTAGFYACAFLLVLITYQEASNASAARRQMRNSPVTFRHVLASENFLLLMIVIFGIQFVDRSFGPVLPLYVEATGTPREDVPIRAGLLFSILAGAGAIGHHSCGRLLRRRSPRRLITEGTLAAAVAVAIFGVTSTFPLLSILAALFGLGLGAAMTAAFTAAGSAVPASVHGTGFGFLTGASLAGLALSPVISGLLSGLSLRFVFALDAVLLLLLAWAVRRVMGDAPLVTAAPVTEDT